MHRWLNMVGNASEWGLGEFSQAVCLLQAMCQLQALSLLTHVTLPPASGGQGYPFFTSRKETEAKTSSLKSSSLDPELVILPFP